MRDACITHRKARIETRDALAHDQAFRRLQVLVRYEFSHVESTRCAPAQLDPFHPIAANTA